MKTLFISTYSELITIGLLENSKKLVLQEKFSERSHSENLVPMISEILEKKQLKLKDLNEIVVINGPGSFTGIRLGITVAKTLAYTLNIPVKTISAIEALAISHQSLTKKLVRINDPKGSYYGIFQNNSLIDELKYLNDNDFHEFLKNNKDLLIVSKQKLNVEAISSHLADKSDINPHEVKALYIKQIEVING